MSDEENYNPKPNDTVEKLLKAREARDKQEAVILENQEEYKKALNSVIGTPNGALVFKTLIKACGVFAPDRGTDVASLIRQSEKRNVYLEFVRPYLTPELKQEVEK